MEHSAPLPRVPTQGEARHIAFLHHAKAARELAALSIQEVDDAMIENQLNMMGIDTAEALEAQDATA